MLGIPGAEEYFDDDADAPSVLDYVDEALMEMQNRCINPWDAWERITPEEATARGLALYLTPAGYPVALKPDHGVSVRLFPVPSVSIHKASELLVFPGKPAQHTTDGVIATIRLTEMGVQIMSGDIPKERMAALFRKLADDLDPQRIVVPGGAV